MFCTLLSFEKVYHMNHGSYGVSNKLPQMFTTDISDIRLRLYTPSRRGLYILHIPKPKG